MTVPRLDLAPKLKRPLSLWNPLDYLRLLYWVFYFPQALRWYGETFGSGVSLSDKKTWREKWQLLTEDTVQLKFLLQGLLLTFVAPLLFYWLLERRGINISWFGVAVGIAVGVLFCVLLSVANGVEVGIAAGVSFSISWGILFSVAVGIAGGVATGIAAFAVFSVAGGIPLGVVTVAAFAVFNVAISLVAGVSFSVSFGITISLSILRLEAWLLGTIFFPNQLWQTKLTWSRTTYLPLFALSSQIKTWINQDESIAIDNINQILRYTLQWIPVVNAINQALAVTPNERIIWRVTQLTKSPFDWKLIHLASTSLQEEMKLRVVDILFLFSGHLQRRIIRFYRGTRLDTFPRATAAGFWYLHEKEPAKALKAFTIVRSLLYGEELFILAQTLTNFHEIQTLKDIAAIPLPTPPLEPWLRPTTWEAIAKFRRAIEDIKVVQSGTSRAARSLALNRAQGALKEILDNKETLPEAERELIIDIAATWQETLLSITAEIGELAITQPVKNPYIVGDPVTGQLFQGREDILRQLEELWVMGEQLQSVVIYGHRRMGKTSLLLNASNCVGTGIKVAFINLQILGNCPQGVVDILIAIADSISEAINLPPPPDEEMLRLPQRAFRRYLKQVEEKLNQESLIVALDEFEKIEELITAGKLSPDFLGFLRGCVQLSSRIAFAFAGLHTLEEMTADYFNPFFASVIPIPITFLTSAATKAILTNPSEDFLLNYSGAALEEIYKLSAGQPYLVQLIGFQLVRLYNDFVFEQGYKRDSTFTKEDVEQVVNNEAFFLRGRYYFEGVWLQAAQETPQQQRILTLLAPQKAGLTLEKLREATDWEEEILQTAFKTLERHDVVTEKEGKWYIIVELFRRWCCTHSRRGRFE